MEERAGEGGGETDFAVRSVIFRRSSAHLLERRVRQRRSCNLDATESNICIKKRKRTDPRTTCKNRSHSTAHHERISDRIFYTMSSAQSVEPLTGQKKKQRHQSQHPGDFWLLNLQPKDTSSSATFCSSVGLPWER